ncbi:lactonase family protein [Mucilaginibacter sp. UR6-11]|uniref:lactonase family protein n=1 Tax=Mucilaginibacter sp. UR6-11 TaxID=1435644 RepID=UPI001E4C5192|nr:lactonase family protein [Mucilaginibacter sp. UR6-11]MCC8424633.1 lactonase family protein [Mucilaginibacter sp. UR6-11]
MKKLQIALLLLLPLAGLAQKKAAPLAKTYDLLLGGYTGANAGNGIAVYRFNTETGKVAFLNQIEGIENPDFLAISNDYKFVYACNVNTTGGEGGVSALKFDSATGKLQLINKQPGGGINPVHIILDKDNKNVFVSYYSSGSLGVLPVNKDGSLGKVSQTLQYTGSGPHKNQKGPHVHASIFSADGQFLMVADLGTDKIDIYKYDNTRAQPLTPADPAFEMTAPGDGPRHLEFSPDQKFLYVIQELSACVRVYKYNNGKLTFVQTINMMPAGYERNGAADLHVSADGNFLYASNRGTANNIVQYAINKQDGKLTLVDRYNVSKAPRGFTIDPSGNFLLSAGQDGNTIIIFKIDKATGKLTLTDNKIDIAQVTCLKWVPAE